MNIWRLNRIRQGSIIFFMMIFMLSLAGAVDYYVDFENGNNVSGDGSQGNPWKNVSYAIKKTEANETDDTFHIAAGNYTNDPQLDLFEREVFPMKIRSGTSLIGAGAGETILDAGYLENTTSRFIENADEAAISDVLIQGITFQNNNVNNSLDGSAIKLDNASGAIRDCEFLNIFTNGDRGAVWINGIGIAPFDFTGNVIRNCQTTGSTSYFAAVSMDNGSGEFSGNTIEDCTCKRDGNVVLNTFEGNIKSNTLKNNAGTNNGSGGMTIINFSNGEIAYNVFDGNKGSRNSGCHLFINSADTRLHHNYFMNAKRGAYGRAALGLSGNCSMEIDNNDFSQNFQDNKADYSGGIYIDTIDGSADIHHNSFTGNKGNDAGAIYFNRSSGSVSDNEFIQNESRRYGILRIYNQSSVDVLNNDFILNTCIERYAQTAGIRADGNNVSGDIIGNRFENNVIDQSHSCLFLENFYGNIIGNFFSGNRTEDQDGYTAYISLNNTTGEMTQIANNFFVDNKGSGVLIAGGTADTRFFQHNTLANQSRNLLDIHGDSWNVYNNIFYGGRTSITELDVYTIQLENNLFYKFKDRLYLDNNQDAYDDLLSLEFWKDEARRNVLVDPLFVNPDEWDYHLSPSSPAIDAAYDGSEHPEGTFPELLYDYDNNVRPIDVSGVNNNVYQGGDDYDEFDIGADELVVGASFTISGFVTDTDGDPIDGVTINLDDLYSSFSDSDVTAADGSYSIGGLTQSRYRLTPQKTDHTFWPHYREESLSYGDKTDVNFESIMEGDPTFLRGKVMDFAFNPISGAKVYITDQAGFKAETRLTDVSTTISTNSEGQFNATVPAGTGYSMIISESGYETKKMYDITAPDDMVIYLQMLRPPAPTGLVARSAADSIKLEWDSSPEPSVIGYNVYRDTRSNGNYETKINESLVRDVNFRDQGVDVGRTYYYKVSALNIAGYESSKSAYANARLGEIDIFVRNARGAAGTIVRIPINLSDAAGVACSGFSVDFTFDDTQLTSPSFEKTVLTNGFTIESTIGSGSMVLTGNCDTPVTIPGGSGRIIDALFKVADDASDQSAIGFGDVTLQDDEDNALTVNKQGAIFTVADNYMLGDIDGDGDVDADDAALGQDIAVDLYDPNDLEFTAGEINGDGRIDAADITLIRRIADGLPLNPSTAVTPPAANYTLSIGSTSANPGDDVELPVSINPFNRVAGADFTIIYDASSLTAKNVALEPGVSTSYILESNIDNAGIIYVTLSDKKDSVLDDSVDLLKIGFEVSASVDDTVIPVSWVKGDVSSQFGQKVRWEGAEIAMENAVIYVGEQTLLSFEDVLAFLLGKKQLGLVEYYQADANRDGIVNAADLVWMILNGYGPSS